MLQESIVMRPLLAQSATCCVTLLLKSSDILELWFVQYVQDNLFSSDEYINLQYFCSISDAAVYCNYCYNKFTLYFVAISWIINMNFMKIGKIYIQLLKNLCNSDDLFLNFELSYIKQAAIVCTCCIISISLNTYIFMKIQHYKSLR